MLHQLFAEVQQISQFHSSQFEIGEQLLLVRRIELLDRFHLYDDFVFDDQSARNPSSKLSPSNLIGTQTCLLTLRPCFSKRRPKVTS